MVALFFTTVGVSLFYFPELNAVRQNMQRQLEKRDSRIELVFTKKAYAQLDWTRREKEFRYKGKMYDVASVKIVGGKVLVSCLFDNEETGLRKKLEAFFSPLSDKNQPLRRGVKVISQKYVVHVFKVFNRFPYFLPFSFKPYFFSLSVFEKEMADPPPIV